MTLNELLAEIRSKCIQLRKSDGELLVRGNDQALAPALISELGAHKLELLALIDGGNELWWSPPVIITPGMLPLVQLTAEEIATIVSAVPGGAANVQDIYPLAPLQEGILFHHLIGGEGDPYLLAALVAFDSRERLDCYLEAVQEVVDRHDILRTSILWEGMREPVQVVWRKAMLPVELVELDAAEEDAARRLYARFDPRRYRTDIRRAPLLRAYIAYDESKERWLMVMLLHHLAGDQTTLEMVQAEIQLHRLGLADRLPPPQPFRNLVAQARLGLSPQEHEAFFRQMLGDVEEPTAPFGLLDAQGDGRGVEEGRLVLDRSLARRLHDRGRALGVSVASLCHLAWAEVLGRVSGHEDVVFGTVLFGRMAAEGAGQVMGPSINTLPIRIRLDEESAAAGVRRTHQLLADLLSHEHASLALAQRCSAVAAPTPLFSALLNYRHHPGAAQAHNEAAVQDSQGVELLYIEERTNYPVTLSVDDWEEGLSLSALAVATIGPARICEFMRMALECLVAALESAPDTPLRALDVLPVQERHQVLHGWNNTRTAFPDDKSVYQLFEAQALESPNAIAVVDEETQLSYGELNQQAGRVASYLSTLEVEPGDRVATLLDRSAELIVAEIAILKCGAAYVPIDPGYPADRIAFIIKDSGANVVLSIEQTELPEMPGVTKVNLGKAASFAGPVQHANATTSDLPAYVMYTSGSSGQPKGVMVPHRAIVRLVINNGYARFEAKDCVAFAANPAFDAATMEVWAPLLNGGRVVVISRDALLDPVQFAQALSRNAVNILWLTVGLFNQYADFLSEQIAGLRYLIIGGDALDPRTVAPTLRRNPPQHFLNGYGPTETTTFAVTHEIKAVPENARSIPIGRPIANTQVYILDEQRRPAPVGVKGELYIGGAGVALGYLNHPELTAETFVADPFAAEAGARMYKTGDLGQWLEDGAIDFLGRCDFQVKIRGYRIELGEIEAALLEYPEIQHAVVLAHEDQGGDKRLAGYFVGCPGRPAVDVGVLRRQLAERLPDYMIPSVLLCLERLPLTANGKVDRKALPVPKNGPASESNYAAPRIPEEEMLAGIFAEVLGLEQVGIEDNFFELGGHSLLATQVVSRVRSAMGVELPLRWLFELATVSGVVKAMKREQAETAGNGPGIERVKNEALPLSFAQERLWFLDQLSPGDATYNIPIAVRIQGDLDVRALDKSISAIVCRHEALRTRFPAVDGEPRQVIDEQVQQELSIVELDGWDQTEIQHRAFQEAQTPFDLAAGPLRTKLLRCGEQDNVLLVTVHHIVSDGWSMGILIRELRTLYEAYSRGEEPKLPELPIRYVDYSAWQKQWLSGPVLDKQLEYWKARLTGLDPLELPADRSRPAVLSSRGAIHELNLERELATALAQLGRRQGVTLYMSLLAVFQIMLYRYTGQTDLAVGSPVAGRTRVETEGLIGLFVNTLVLRTRVEPQWSFQQLLQEVKETTLQAYAHQDVSFEKVVEALSPDRDLGSSPLFQVMLVLQNGVNNELRLRTARLTPLRVETGTSKLELTLSLETREQGLAGALEYSVDLFDASTIARIAGHLRVLLQSALAEPQKPLGLLPLLTHEEQEQILVEWNRTGQPHASTRCVHELFEAQVARTPDAVAVMHEGEELSYQELNWRSNQLAHYLQTMEVGPETRVGICLERRTELVIALMSVLKAGGVYVPLDPAYPPERLAFMLKDSQTLLLVSQQRFKQQMSSCIDRILILEDVQEEIGRQGRENLNVRMDPENLSWVIYTSGSTGRPKGSGIRHSSAVTMIEWARDVFTEAELSGVLAATSICFDISTFELFVPLSWGGAVILAENALQLPDLRCAAKVRLLNTVPSAMVELVRMGALMPGIRTANLAGEALQRRLVDELYQTTTVERVLNLYGPSEDTTYSTYAEVERGGYGNVPIGRPLPSTQLYVLDSQLEPVPIGAKGELCIGGAGLSRGYLNRPGLTAEKFIPNPFTGVGERLYRTGDLVRYLPDGTLEFLGRLDHQVKIRGYRIESGEIELAMLKHPSVGQAVVIVREDQPGNKRLVGYAVSKPEAGPWEISDLRDYLKQQLPEYMVPSAFVPLDRLPLNPNGKIDRKALPRPEHRMDTASYVGPRTREEEILCAIWADLLGTSRVGVHDNFFKLGGHSLLAVRLMAAIRKIWGKTLPLSTLFQGGTIEHLARRLAQEAPIPWSSLIGLQRGPGRPFFCIHPVGGNVLCYADLAQGLSPEWSFYGLQARGLAPGRLPDSEIEVMASHYISEVQSLQSSGPYFLGGWSFGGLVALEMARQLRAQGESIAMLAMIDTRPPGKMGITSLDDMTLLREFAMDLGLPFDRLPEEAETHSVDQQLELIVRESRAANLLPPDEGLDFARRLFEVFAANVRAAIAYPPAYYDGRLTLFTAQERFAEDRAGSVFADADPTYGWQEFFAGIECSGITGNHYSMMRAPNVDLLARRLVDQLDKAAAEWSGEPLAAHAKPA